MESKRKKTIIMRKGVDETKSLTPFYLAELCVWKQTGGDDTESLRSRKLI